MSRRKKKKKERNFSAYKEIDISRRDFYINSILEFSLFYDSSIIDKKEIIDNFLESSDWKDFEKLYKVKFKSFKISEDLQRVDIITKPSHSNKKK